MKYCQHLHTCLNKVKNSQTHRLTGKWNTFGFPPNPPLGNWIHLISHPPPTGKWNTFDFPPTPHWEVKYVWFPISTLLYWNSTLLYSTTLYSTALHYTMLYCTILNYAPLCHLMLCSAMHSTLLCSALLSSGLLSSPLLYSTLIYSSILHHTILCICTLGEPWAACPRIILQFSYNLHRKNNTRQSAQEFSSNYLITYIGKTTQQLVKELPEYIPKTSKIPPKAPPKTP